MKYLFISLTSVLFFLGCNRETGKNSGKTVFRYNEAANITSLDPAFAKDQPNIWPVHQLFNGLVELNEKAEVIPCVARNWSISENGREYIFHLRNDVFFHDSHVFTGGKGRNVVAQDFVFSFSRTADPKTESPGLWIFHYVEQKNSKYSFEAPDDSTFVIRLQQPFPPFIGLLTTVYCSVVPHEAIDYYGENFRKNPVGTGPFQFKMWKEGVKLVFVKNPHYFEFENCSRLPNLDAVAITFLSDKQSAFLEFSKGNLDFISGIDPTYKDELLTMDGKLNPKFAGRFRLITQPYLNTEYLGFLVDPASPVVRNNPVRLKAIRKAVNYAFDRTKMIRFLRNNIGTPGINGIIPKGMPSFDSATVYYEYNPNKARQLLADAGFPDGAGLPPVVLSTTSDYLDLCKYIQHEVSGAGIIMKIDIVPPAALKEMKAQAKLPFFRASWIADYPDAESYLSLFDSRNFCPGGPNYSHFSSKEYDNLYEKAMAEVNDSVRYQYYHEMERLIMEESPVVILYYDQVLRFVQKNINGLGSDPMNLLTLKRVTK
jgi:oligopeptide transport system substrate-binding protein